MTYIGIQKYFIIIYTYIRHICRRHIYTPAIPFCFHMFLHLYPPQREYACNVTTPDPDKVPQRLPCRCGRKGSTRMILEKRKSAILEKEEKALGSFWVYRFYGLVGEYWKTYVNVCLVESFCCKKKTQVARNKHYCSISYKRIHWSCGNLPRFA